MLSGVGLDMVATAVRQLGGELLISSERGVGTAFTLRLPTTQRIMDVLHIDLGGGHRAALPNASLHVHQPLGGFQGQATDIDIHAREILTLRQRLNEILAKHTGQSLETIARDTERDNFKSAFEAQAYGLVDQVLERRPDESIQAG